MIPLKPYLIRSVYEWINDNGWTPYLTVNADKNKGNLPQEHVSNGVIIFNIRSQAVEALSLGNDLIEFNARFSGKAMTVVVSVDAVIAIQAKENNQGFVFEQADDSDTPPPEPPPAKKPILRVVK